MAESLKKSRISPGAARFQQLVSRALFELRLAGDLARAEGYDPGVTALVEQSKRNLRACLDKAEGGRSRGESEAR
jgi:hypothetical protein